MTSPNIGQDGTLDVLVGGGSSAIWSLDIHSGVWRRLGYAPGPVGPGGAISNLSNSCDFAFVGEGSTGFFSTGTMCDHPQRLAGAPEPAGPGGALAAAVGLVGAPVDSVFALRGAGTADFWRFSISKNAWTVLPAAPAPAGDGAALAEVPSCASGDSSALFQIAALRGGDATDFWCFDIARNVWLNGIPPLPAAVWPGGSIAQLQRLGRIYVRCGEEERQISGCSNPAAE